MSKEAVEQAERELNDWKRSMKTDAQRRQFDHDVAVFTAAIREDAVREWRDSLALALNTSAVRVRDLVGTDDPSYAHTAAHAALEPVRALLDREKEG